MWGSIFLLLFPPLLSFAQLSNLTGYYDCDDGGHYYIRHEGTKVWWYGEHPSGQWAVVLKGNLTGRQVHGNFYSIPKGFIRSEGALTLQVSADGRTITKTSQRGPYAGSTWKKKHQLPQAMIPSTIHSGFHNNGNPKDMSGNWRGNDGGSYYLHHFWNWGPTSYATIVWFGERAFSSGKPGWANIAIGSRQGKTIRLEWLDSPKGNTLGKGTLELEIRNTNELVRKKVTGGFGGSRWTRRTPTSPIQMSGYFSANDGGQYFVRQMGNKVYWFGEHKSGNWANVFEGKLNGQTLTGTFYDVPKGGATGHGNLVLHVAPDGQSFSKVSGAFGGSQWTRKNLPSKLIKPVDIAKFHQNGQINTLDGTWKTDQGNYYVRQLGNKVVWFAEKDFSSGRPSWAHVAFGTRSGNRLYLDWIDLIKGQSSGQGKLEVIVSTADEMNRSSATGGFGDLNWKRKPIPVTFSDLTGFYNGSDGGQYFISQVGQKVYWYGEDRSGNWANVYAGDLSGTQISGHFYDVPKGRIQAQGALSLSVSPDGKRIEKVSGVFGAHRWTKAPLPTNLVPSSITSGFHANGDRNNMSGIWFTNKGGVYYMRQFGTKVVWFGEEVFQTGRPRFSNIAVGDKYNDVVRLKWVGSQKSNSKAHGSLVLRLRKPDTLIKSSQTGGFSENKWIRGVDLNGYFSTPGGGAYFIRQKGDKVFWFGEHASGAWANVFEGELNGLELRGTFYDVPKGNARAKGQLVLKVSPDGQKFEKISGAFGDVEWNRSERPLRYLNPTGESGFNQNGNIQDLDGTWRSDIGATYYIRQYGNKVVWFAEEDFASGQPDWSNVAFGTRTGNQVTLNWIDVPKGRSENGGSLTLQVIGPDGMISTGRQGIFFSRSYQETYEITSTYYDWFPAKAHISILYGASSNGAPINTLDKVIILAEGFDPHKFIESRDDFDIESAKELLPLEELAVAGYDIVFVNYHEGTASIRENGKLLSTVIEWVNRRKVGNEPNIVAGFSMGGLVARIGLRYLETINIDHETRLYISIDAPHQGANIPLGFQYMIKDLARGSCTILPLIIDPDLDEQIDFDVDGFSRLLNEPATKELLIRQTSSGREQVRKDFLTYYQNLGYPQNCRNIAVSNGSILGEMAQIGEEENILKARKKGKSSGAKYTITLRVNALPQNQNKEVYYLKVRTNRSWIIFGWGTCHRKKKRSGISDAWDSAPGGHMRIFDYAKKSAFRSLGEDREVNEGSFCFIPTLSSLDIPRNQVPNLQTSLLDNTNIANLIPFDAVHGERRNQPHVGLTESAKSFLFREMILGPSHQVINTSPARMASSLDPIIHIPEVKVNSSPDVKDDRFEVHYHQLSKILRIESMNLPIQEVSLMDLTGKVLKKWEELNTQQIKLAAPSLSRGRVYVAWVRFKDRSYGTKKFVIH